MENEYQWRQFLNGKVVSDEFAKLLDRLTAYRVKERPNSVADALQDLGIKTSLMNISYQSKVPNTNALIQNPSKSSISLISAKGIDYRELETLLMSNQGRKADELTSRLVLKAVGREKKRLLNVKDIKDFPREDFHIIDQLWLHYSNGKFGFSVQIVLWLRCGGQFEQYDYEVWKQFASKVGWYNSQTSRWRTYSEFMRSTKNAQNACLASFPCIYTVLGLKGRNCLFSRKDLSKIQ